MKHIGMISMAVVLASCAAALAEGSDTNAVIRSFQRQAMALVAEQANTNLQTFLTTKIQDSAHLHAGLTTYSNCFQRIDGTLSETERKKLILRGNIPDLKRHGNCWVVESFGGKVSEICGYVDPKSEKLILFWIVPEG